jgi:hypothetical protein
MNEIDAKADFRPAQTVSLVEVLSHLEAASSAPAARKSAAEPPLQFRPMLAGDAVLLELQPQQHFELGRYHSAYTLEEGAELADNGDAWTAHRGSRIVTIAGFRELFPGHAVVWASLSSALGADHLAISRFARWQIENTRFRRLEAIVEAANLRAIDWARLVGLEPVHTLRGYGPDGSDHILFERVK